MSTTASAKPPVRFGLAIGGILAHAILVLVLFVLFVSTVPAAKKTFNEYGVALPWVTQSVIRLSNWIADYWFVLAPVVLLAGAADFAVVAVLRARSKRLSMLWVVLVSLVLTSFIAVTTVALELPKATLREGLNR